MKKFTYYPKNRLLYVSEHGRKLDTKHPGGLKQIATYLLVSVCGTKYQRMSEYFVLDQLEPRICESKIVFTDQDILKWVRGTGRLLELTPMPKIDW